MQTVLNIFWIVFFIFVCLSLLDNYISIWMLDKVNEYQDRFDEFYLRFLQRKKRYNLENYKIDGIKEDILCMYDIMLTPRIANLWLGNNRIKAIYSILDLRHAFKLLLELNRTLKNFKNRDIVLNFDISLEYEVPSDTSPKPNR